MLAALELAPPCLPINLGSGIGVAIAQVVETILREVPSPPAVEWDATKPAGDPVRVLRTTRAKEVLGFQPKTSLEDGVRGTIQWYAENKDLAKA